MTYLAYKLTQLIFCDWHTFISYCARLYFFFNSTFMIGMQKYLSGENGNAPPLNFRKLL